MAGFDLTAEITAVLKQYTGEVADKVDKAVEKCGKGMRKEISAASPKLTGDYGKGWQCEITRRGRGDSSALVKNKTDYQLTHLLERGHKSRRKRRGKAFVPAIPHIAPAEEKWNSEFERQCEEACKAK